MRGFRPASPPPQSPAGAPAASARTYAELRARILDGRIASGAVLSEVEVASELGVSRTPVRDAIRALLGDGLLEEGARRQVQVRALSVDASAETQLILAALSGVVARQAAARATAEDIDLIRLSRIRLTRAANGDQPAEWLNEANELLLTLCGIAQMPLLAETLRRQMGLDQLGRVSGPAPTRAKAKARAALELLVDALERHDPDAAEQAMAIVSGLRDSSGTRRRPVRRT